MDDNGHESARFQRFGICLEMKGGASGMKPNNPAAARTRHIWRAARQQSGVPCAIPLAASGIGVRPAPPTAHTIPAKALPQSISFAHILPTLFQELAGN